MLVHSDGLLVGKKIYIIQPLVAKPCNISLVSINTSVQLSVGINPVGRYMFILMPLTATYGNGIEL